MVFGTLSPTQTTGIGEFKVAVNSGTAFQEAYRPSIQGTPPEADMDFMYSYPRLTTSPGSRTLELLGEKPETFVPSELERPSRAFAEFTTQRNLKKMLGLLGELKLNLDKPEGARTMAGFRQRLADAWSVRSGLPKERVLLLSAVEEVVRGKKWRDLSSAQIDVLERLLRQAGDVTLTAKKMAEAFRAIHKSQMNLYPAASVDEDDDGYE